MKHRNEIDGLRAIAVLPVILFHAGFSTFSGGFVGVDVFFVISGYLITSIIVREINENKFSILNFYERRVRRIIPALFVVVALTTPAAHMIMIPNDFEKFTQSVLAAITFLANHHFYATSGYFENSSELVPLLHTWSLAVEEQFYILFPLFMTIFYSRRPRLALRILVAVGLASLAAAQWASHNDPSAAFYLLPTRIWEILFGAMAALYQYNHSDRLSKFVHNLLSTSGLAMICIAIFFYDKAIPFPSIYALLPTGGAVLVILYAIPGTICHRLLSLQPLVGVGLISYSLYLWHQPLFAFARLEYVEGISTNFKIFLVPLTFILAYITWRFVEQPFRTRATFDLSRTHLFVGTGAVAAMIAGSSALSDNKEYFLSRLSPIQARLAAYVGYNDTEEFSSGYRTPHCFISSVYNSFSYYEPERCLASSSPKTNVLLIGDSHAAHLWKAFNDEFSDLNIMQANSSGCRPLTPFEGAERCTDLMRYVWDDFLPTANVDAIILSGRWREEDLPRLAGTIRSLRQFSDVVIVMGPTVEYRGALPLLLSKQDEISPAMPMLHFVDPYRFELSDAMRPIVETAGATYVPVAESVCPADACTVLTDAGEPMAWDYGHFTLGGARRLVRTLKQSGAFPPPFAQE